ncbi:hypothetical protein BSY19_4733 (plasmid) [Bosea sp. RAC05]|nr:hypothetical protein BSY19_4733 [Bosea sp. RAC05]
MAAFFLGSFILRRVFRSPKPGPLSSLMVGMAIGVTALITGIFVEDAWRSRTRQHALDDARRSATPEIRQLCEEVRQKGLQPGSRCPLPGE